MGSSGTSSGSHDYVRNRGQAPRYPGADNRRYPRPVRILSVLHGIFSTVLLCVFILLLVLHTVSLTPVVRDLLNEIEIASYMEDYDYIYDNYLLHQINGLPFNNTTVSYEDIEMFIRSDAVSGEIGGVLDGYIRAFAAGNPDHHITAAEVADISKNIRPELNELFDQQMTDEDIEYLSMILDDIVDFRAMSVSGLMEDLDVVLPVPQFLISTGLLWVLGLIITGLLAGIVFLRRSNLPDGFLTAGIPVALSGLIIFTSGIWLDASLDLLSTNVHHLAIHLEGPAVLMSRYGFIFAAAGIIIIVVSIMIKRFSPASN